jgi:hypothetical protein
MLSHDTARRSHSLFRCYKSRSATVLTADNHVYAASNTYTATLYSSAIRANPCPEVTDPFCRLPLPTLFYRPEAVNLGDLLRISVRLGANFTRIRCRCYTTSQPYFTHSHFQGPARALRTPQEPWCFSESPSLSLAEPLPGTRFTYKEKTTLPEARHDVCELVSVTSFGPTTARMIDACAASKFGNINPIPFRQRSVGFNQKLHPTALADSLHTSTFTRFRAWLRAD